jgi:hypothetical protein
MTQEDMKLVCVVLFVCVHIHSTLSFQRQISDPVLRQEQRCMHVMPRQMQLDVLRWKRINVKPLRSISSSTTMVYKDKRANAKRRILSVRVVTNMIMVAILFESLYKIHIGSTMEVSVFPFTLFNGQLMDAFNHLKKTRSQDV